MKGNPWISIAVLVMAPLLLSAYAGPAVWLDPFDSEALDPTWFWLNENPEGWSLAERPGYMRIYASTSPTGGENLLLRSGAQGNFAIEAHLLFEPHRDFQFAGLVIYQDQANFLQFGRAFCDDEEACVQNGIYFDHIGDGDWVDGNFATRTNSMNEAYLRLELNGRRITAFYSENGEGWQEVGRHEVPSSFRANGVGLTSSQNYSGEGIAADFNFFSFTGQSQPSSPFVGHWQAIDGDGSDIRLTIGGPPDGPFNITWTESYIGYCNREAGIVRGTGWLNPDDPYVLEAELHLECFTTGEALDMDTVWRYDPLTDRLTAGGDGEVATTWHRPGQPLPWAWRQIIAHPDEDWVEGWGFEEGAVVSLVIFDPAATLLYYDTAVAAYPEWDPDNAYVQFNVDYDLQAGDHLWMTDGSYAKDLMVTTLEITEIDLLASTVSGSAEAGSEVIIEYPPDLYFGVIADQDGAWTATVPDLSPGTAGLASQDDEDGDLTRVTIIVPRLELRVNYGHDWVESFYEAGREVTLTVTESDGETVKATATVFTEPKDFWGGETGFQTTPEDWSPGQPDLQPYDWVTAEVDNGVTAQVQLGDIRGEVFIFEDRVTGTIDAPWIDDPVPVECLDWGSGLDEPINKDDGVILTNGDDPYSCSWDPESEWDLGAWQDVGVGYFTPDGHWVANAFHAEHWMAMWTYDLPAGFWEEGDHSYYFQWAYTVPEPDGRTMDPMMMTVSSGTEGEETPLYDGYVLIQPWASAPQLAWTGSTCEVVPVVHPGQPTRFVWGWVNDYSMNYDEALAHFESFTVEAFWDGETSGSAQLTRGDLLEFTGIDARWEYRCSLTEHP